MDTSPFARKGLLRNVFASKASTVLSRLRDECEGRLADSKDSYYESSELKR
jgi:hypothetical protein